MAGDLRARIEARLAIDEHGWNHYDDHPHDAEHDLRALMAATAPAEPDLRARVEALLAEIEHHDRTHDGPVEFEGDRGWADVADRLRAALGIEVSDG